MKKVILAGAAIIALAGCYNDSYDKLYPTPTKPATCDTTTISYTHDIVPILNTNCNSASCHAPSGSSGYDLTDTVTLQGVALGGILVNDINFTPTGRNHDMPKDLPKLGSCDINKITRWVNLGANCSN